MEVHPYFKVSSSSYSYKHSCTIVTLVPTDLLKTQSKASNCRMSPYLDRYLYDKTFETDTIGIDYEVIHYFITALLNERMTIVLDNIFFNLFSIEIRSNLNCNSNYIIEGDRYSNVFKIYFDKSTANIRIDGKGMLENFYTEFEI